MNTEPQDPILKSLNRAIHNCQTLLDAAIRNHDHDARDNYQVQLTHLETKLENYNNGLYDNLKMPGDIRRGY